MRLLLADDHPLIRGGLRALVAGLPEITEVLEAADGEEALAAVVEHRPEIVLMDIAMPRLGGLEATSLILDAAPATRVIIVSMHHDGEYVRRALLAGACGYVSKSALVEELHKAVRAALRGETYISLDLRDAAGEMPRQPLTQRQHEVLRMIADGLTSREIASALGIAFKTVIAHRMHLMRRLDIHDVAGLVRYAVHHRLVAI